MFPSPCRSTTASVLPPVQYGRRGRGGPPQVEGGPLTGVPREGKGSVSGESILYTLYTAFHTYTMHEIEMKNIDQFR